ncbi:MAG: DUF3098 domain-containing protein [Saprospiraceae bacterium]|nr:DUF3098 domain-containing protein [Saprospiraceae bacterium]
MGEAKSKKPDQSANTAKSVEANKTPQTAKGLTYNHSHIRVVLLGLGLIAVGLALMSGGSMPSPEVWDESIIYSFRRTVLAPAFIIAGLAVEVYAIFKN